MTIGLRKTIAGTAAGLVGVLLVIPAAFWLGASALDRLFGLKPVIYRPASQILCAASILIGVFWISWAYSFLVFVGKGLPLEAFGRAVHPTRFLVTTGPYAYTRNPTIFGLLFVLLGVALLRGSVSGLILVPVLGVLLCLYLVAFEEKGLARRFGVQYDDYRRSVSILIPRPTPYVRQPVTGSD